MNAIEIYDLSKTYDNFRLDNINLTLPGGCIMGLIGENGAGKSTVIRLILDIIERDSGTVNVLGRDNRDNFALTKEDIGVVIDDVGVPEHLTGKEVNRIMSYTYTNWNKKIFFYFLDKFSVPHDKEIKKLSKGTKMKLMLAIALSHEAKLLILDEATNGLDPIARNEIMDIMFNFTRNENHSVLISSHIVSDLEKICDYIAFLHKGKLLLCEEKDVLKDQYGIIRCTSEFLGTLPPYAVKDARISPYGAEGIVLRSFIPQEIPVYPIDLEQLFVFIIKEVN